MSHQWCCRDLFGVVCPLSEPSQSRDGDFCWQPGQPNAERMGLAACILEAFVDARCRRRGPAGCGPRLGCVTSMKTPLTFLDVQERLAHIPDAANRSRAEMYLRRKSWKPQSKLSVADPMVALGQRLGSKPWVEAIDDDIFLAIDGHRYHRGPRRFIKTGEGKELAASTKYQWCSHLRSFYQWLLDTDGTPKMFRGLDFPKQDAMRKRCKELALLPDQVSQLLAGAQSVRDRFIILLLLETGFRVSEAAALRLDTMERRDHGYWFTLDPSEPLLKRGPRDVDVPLIVAQRELEAWLAVHPHRHEKRAPLLVNLSNRNYGSRMSGKTISEVVKRCARRAGLEKVHAHMMRHTSATLKLRRGMKPHVIRQIHGWTEDSTMLGYYTHMLPHYKAEVLEAYGLPSDEPVVTDLMGGSACQLCGTANQITAVECEGCHILLADAAQESYRLTREAQLLDYVVAGAIESLRKDLFLEVAEALGFTGGAA